MLLTQNGSTWLVIVGIHGRLCNQLFLNSHLIAFAVENKFCVANLIFGRQSDYFEDIYRSAYCEFPSRNCFYYRTNIRRLLSKLYRGLLQGLLKTKWGRKRIKLIKLNNITDLIELSDHKFIEEIRKAKIVLFHGWRFRSEKLLLKHKAVIQNHFRPRKKIQRRLDSFEAELRREIDLLVGVHIRRTDYRRVLGGKYAYELDVFINNMKRIQTMLPHQRIRFLVCSDENMTASPFAGLDVRPGPGDEIGDLLLLSKCDYLIGVPSTFLIWASFYGDCPCYVIEEADYVPNLEDFTVNYYKSDDEERYFFTD